MYIVPNQMPNHLKTDYQPDDGQYAFISWKWVKPLAQWIGERTCLEVMAGRGMLCFALRKLGIDIIATDDFSWNLKDTVTSVEPLDALSAVKRYGRNSDILLMSWPPATDTAFYVLQAFCKENPNGCVVYIGETLGGDMATELFFKHFQTIWNPFFDEVSKAYETRFGYYDKPMLGRFR